MHGAIHQHLECVTANVADLSKSVIATSQQVSIVQQQQGALQQQLSFLQTTVIERRLMTHFTTDPNKKAALEADIAGMRKQIHELDDQLRSLAGIPSSAPRQSIPPPPALFPISKVIPAPTTALSLPPIITVPRSVLILVILRHLIKTRS
ncbi:hypothetical protein PQX77_002258 [Marasmius sp. AFHP31]|nr:hypothetical protein PQX77_002258 [Marasmius sp. AFHP31]